MIHIQHVLYIWYFLLHAGDLTDKGYNKKKSKLFDELHSTVQDKSLSTDDDRATNEGE